MDKFVSPICLFLALAMLIAGFGLWSVDPPEASVELHAARVHADDQMEQALESRLVRRQWKRTLLLTSLFTGSGLMVLIAFAAMRPSSGRS